MAMVTFEEIAPGVGKITLNDPDALNAMGEGMARDFAQVVADLKPQATRFRSIILTGAGRAFSAGGDLEMLEGKTKLSGEENRLRMHQFYYSFLDILDLGVPLVAAINGHAVGAGLCVACACDVRIAADGAKLGFTFTRLGLHPGMGASYFLPRILGRARASELLLTGRMITAGEAKELGLVSRVVPTDQVMAEALKVVSEISECGPQCTRQLLETLRGDTTRSLAESLEREALCQATNYVGEEFKEGVRSVREKRKANFG